MLFRSLFDNFIKPLHPRNVTLRSSDKQIILYDDRTVKHLPQLIVEAGNEDHIRAPDGEQVKIANMTLMDPERSLERTSLVEVGSLLLSVLTF